MIVRFLAKTLLPRSRQGRIVAAGSAIDAIANGLFLAAATLYFIQFLGISAVAVGGALAIANVAGLLSPVPFGALAGRLGARQVFVGLSLVRAAGFGAYALVDDYTGYLIVTCVVTAAMRAATPLLQVIVGEFETSAERTQTMGSLRAIANIGLTVGFMLAALVQAAQSRAAFVGLFVFNALMLVGVACAIVAASRAVVSAQTMPGQSPALGTGEPVEDSVVDSKRALYRDKRFIIVTCANAVLHLHDCVLFILLPLWVVQRAGLSPSVSSALLAINTVLTVVFQVTVSRFARGAAKSLRMLRLACVFLVLACALFAGADGRSQVVALVVTVLAVLLLTAGENLHAVARWELSYEMSPPASRAQYLSFFSTGQSAQLIVGPFLVTALLLPGGAVGWLVLASLFLAATTTVVLAAKPFAVPPSPSEPEPTQTEKVSR